MSEVIRHDNLPNNLDASVAALGEPKPIHDCLHEAIAALGEQCKQIFPRQFVRGITIPREGDTRAYLQAWTAIVEVRAFEIANIVEEMALAIDHTNAMHNSKATSQIERVRQIARDMLHDLQPGSSLHDSYLGQILHKAPLTPFVEAMQIQQGVADLLDRYLALASSCVRSNLTR